MSDQVDTWRGEQFPFAAAIAVTHRYRRTYNEPPTAAPNPNCRMPPLVQLNNVSIGFRGPALLDDVTCSIEAGQHIGLLGRNGSGKTTLMRIIAGQMTPDHGQLVIAPRARV